MEWLSSVYLGCFIFGLVFTIISFLIGGLGHLGNIHLGGDAGHVDLGHAGHVGHVGHVGHLHEVGHADAESSHSHDSDGGLPFFNLTALIVFLTWFGGVGFILTALQFEPLMALPLAVVGGLVAYFGILLFLSKVLFASQTPIMSEADYKLNGMVGRVSSVIQAGGVGEVIFNQAGGRRFTAARSADGKRIERDTEVVFLGVENGIALVSDLDEMLKEPELDLPETPDDAPAQEADLEALKRQEKNKL
ncbi:MAG: NfeD family protein [Chloroflexi bacterium]|mgnify:CR=1 FL=1|nr:NfeD family protein [Chloroflexota bacterium]OJW04317.1 MAG: hypothetical protein BGO39_11160 [Chloroflexi bacterium 54-19]